MAYNNFDQYVLRTPLLSLSSYLKLTDRPKVDEQALLQRCKDPVIQEALLLASPSIYIECLKWVEGHLTDAKRKEKLIFSLLKYLSRMSSRCTPFGLFAGTSVGQIADQTNIRLEGIYQNDRHTRLDMNFLVAFAQNLTQDPNIRQQLQYFPNSSLYTTGDRLRYVEYYYEGGNRFHQIVAVETSDYLERLLRVAKSGATIKTLSQELVDDEISIEEATEYVNQLIDSQLLISELEPSVAGPEFQQQINNTLRKLSGTAPISALLDQINEALAQLDQELGHPGLAYRQITDLLQQTGTEFDRKYLFQIDMQSRVQQSTLSQELMNKVHRAARFFNKLTMPKPESQMSQFQQAFYSRYEDAEVPLAQALDVEQGIGFLQGNDSGDVSPLLNGIDFPEPENNIQELKWSPISALLKKKLTDCLTNRGLVMQLSDTDIPDATENWDDLPDTLSALVEVVHCNGEETVIMNTLAGSNGATLLGRFCHGDKAIHQHTQSIIDCEQRMNEGKVMAEILHLPEARVGNVILRPSLRPYEIPYLANSTLPREQQISIDDLTISTRPHSRVLLKSRRLDKEVVPCLTVAHNFANTALPIYQFLASIGMQQKRKSIGFNWPQTFEAYDFLPRVTYESIILSPAIWHLSKADILMLSNNQQSSDQLSEANKEFLEARKIPAYATLVQGDNELLINTLNVTSLRMLLDLVKKEERVQLKEFLHNEQGPVKADGETWTNQVILSFYNETKRNAHENE